jgi:hypothetical protein
MDKDVTPEIAGRWPTVVKHELSVPTCLVCGRLSPSWAQACSKVCADKVHARWERGLTPLHTQPQKSHWPKG